jgi:hypothetical protein
VAGERSTANTMVSLPSTSNLAPKRSSQDRSMADAYTFPLTTGCMYSQLSDDQPVHDGTSAGRSTGKRAT